MRANVAHATDCALLAVGDAGTVHFPIVRIAAHIRNVRRLVALNGPARVIVTGAAFQFRPAMERNLRAPQRVHLIKRKGDAACSALLYECSGIVSGCHLCSRRLLCWAAGPESGG